MYGGDFATCYCGNRTNWHQNNGAYSVYCSIKCLTSCPDNGKVLSKKRIASAETHRALIADFEKKFARPARFKDAYISRFAKAYEAVRRHSARPTTWQILTELESISHVLCRVWLHLPGDFALKESISTGKQPIAAYCQCGAEIKTFFRGKWTEHCSNRCGTLDLNVQRRRKRTTKDRYGVENIFQLDSVKEKARELCCNKTVHLHGRKQYVQGYEDKALKYLTSELKVSERRIAVSTSGDVPAVKYMFGKRRCTYFPDMYIADKNILIEVKSPFTLANARFFDRNLAKAKASIAQGFDYRVLVMTAKGVRIKLPKTWHKMTRVQLVKHLSSCTNTTCGER
jgi:hypothetical protein